MLRRVSPPYLVEVVPAPTARKQGAAYVGADSASLAFVPVDTSFTGKASETEDEGPSEGTIQMGWKGALRAAQADVRRAERESERQQKQLALAQELDSAEREFWQQEAYIEVLTTLHAECSPARDWVELAGRPEPKPPSPSTHHLDRALGELSDYHPTLLDRVLRRVERETQRLNGRIGSAPRLDQEDHQRALAAHEAALGKWAESVSLAKRVLAGELDAFAEAIGEAEPFSDIPLLGVAVSFSSHEDRLFSAMLHVEDESVIPSEAKNLLKSGRLSSKQMPKGRFFELYQTYVCSAVLRVGGELLALLPIEFVVVNAISSMLDPATGHTEEAVILSVAVQRAAFEQLNLPSISPSASMTNFVHNMDFKKTKGLARVAALDPTQFE
jgi:hypothetical protein